MTKRGKKQKANRGGRPEKGAPEEAAPAGSPETAGTAPSAHSSAASAAADAPESDLEHEAPAVSRSDRLLVGATALAAGLLALIQVGSSVEGSSIWRRLAGGRLLTSGVWPAADPFVFTRAGSGWDNFEWLFDLSVYQLYLAGGAPLAVACKALAVVWAAWLLARLKLPNASNLCPVLAVLCALAVSGRAFTLAPIAFSFVAIAWVLWVLERQRQGQAGWPVWSLIPLAAVWANVDARAAIGVLLVGGYWAGSWIASSLQTGKTHAGPAAAVGDVRQLGLVWFGMCLASLATPGFASAWTAFFQQLAGPGETAMAVFGDVGAWSLYRAASWPAGGPTAALMWREWLVAGLFVVTLVTFALPQPRLAWERLGLLLPAIAWAPSALDNLSLAAVVLSVVASLNVQSSTLTLPPLAGLVARGVGAWGGLLAISVLGMTGRLRSAVDYDFGVDFSPQAVAEVQGLQAFFSRLPAEARGFYMLPAHGNLAAWASPGRQGFLDTRWAAFSQPTLVEYQELRMAIRDGADATWQSRFDREKLDFVLVHVPPLAPETATYDRLLGRRGWLLVHLGANTAAFFRTDCQLPGALAFLRSERFDGFDLAFRVQGPLLSTTPEPVSEPDWLRDKVWRMETSPPAVFAEGYNLWKTAGTPVWPADRRLPYALAAIGKLRQSFLERPQFRPAYITLAQAYERLIQLEAQTVGTPINQMHDLRRSQLLSALNAAERAEPENVLVAMGLAQWELQSNLIDLGGQHLAKARALRAEITTEFPAELDARLNSFPKAEQIDSHLAEARAAVDKAKAAGRSPAEMARVALERSCPGLAMEILGDEARLLPLDAPGFNTLVQTALSCGRPQLARRTIERYVASLAAELDMDQMAWMQGWLELLEGNYQNALGAWESSLREVTNRQGIALTEGTRRLLEGQLEPMVGAMGESFADPLPLIDRQVLTALVWLEAGQPEGARERLRLALGGVERHPLAPLVAYYWEKLTDEPFSNALTPQPPAWEPRPLPLGQK